MVCPGIKFGERNFFWAWYKLKLISALYFYFVPSPERGDKPSGIDNNIFWEMVKFVDLGVLYFSLVLPV
jgi:hypothetical protein